MDVVAASRALFVASLLLLAGRVEAQETKKFNAKQLETDFSLPVYSGKGITVERNEVIVTSNEIDRETSADYYVRGKSEKAREFFTKALGEPRKEGSDEEGYRWTYTKHAGRTRLRLVVREEPGSSLTRITLIRKQFMSSEDAKD